MQYQILSIEKKRPWLKKWKLNQASTVKEVKKISIQKDLSK